MPPTHFGIADPWGAGELSVTGILVALTGCDLFGQGSLLVDAEVLVTGTAQLTGEGYLLADVNWVLGGIVDLVGRGELSGNALIITRPLISINLVSTAVRPFSLKTGVGR